MLVIRLARTGKKKQAYYRLVVADKRRAVSAKFIEILGNYDPHVKKLSVNAEKLNEYIKKGAQPSNTVAKLLAKEKFELPKWVKIQEKVKKKKTKGKAEAKPQVEKADEKTETEDTQKDESKAEEKGSQPTADQSKVEKTEGDKPAKEPDEKPKEKAEQSEPPAENADENNKNPQKKEGDGKDSEPNIKSDK